MDNASKASATSRGTPPGNTSAATPLSWGYKFLMCPPEFFEVAYEINPWMHREVTVDVDLAWTQWLALRETLEAAGAEIKTIEPVEGLPDMVFTANAGLVSGKSFIPTSFLHEERQGETPHTARWFRQQGSWVRRLPKGTIHEGAGDALPFGDFLVSGHRTRSDEGSHDDLARMLDVEVLTVELTDSRLYHLDLVFCPLDSSSALVAPSGMSSESYETLLNRIAEPILIDHDEALKFVANSVVVGSKIIMPNCTPQLESKLRRSGFTVIVVELSEFAKAGGACRCLTLALDVQIGA